MFPKTLTIAGSDSSGGAGIQADLKTFMEYGTFGFTAITSVVTMNPEAGWSHTVTPLDAELVAKQLTTIFTGSPIAALKTGMLGSVETIHVARDYIQKHEVHNVVIDPVMACKGTAGLLHPEHAYAMRDLLLPLAKVTTPNLIEAGILSEMGELTTTKQMEQAAKKIKLLGPEYVVIKGGKRLPTEEAVDLFYDGSQFHCLTAPKIAGDKNHGAGCTFAAAITAGLAKGWTVENSIRTAKAFVAAAIAEGIEINPYVGHVWHGAYNHAKDRMLERNDEE